jgi:hypothetical protein
VVERDVTGVQLVHALGLGDRVVMAAYAARPPTLAYVLSREGAVSGELGTGGFGGCRKMEDFGEGKEKLTWRSETHELGRRTGKLLEQIVF